ncbi:MAG: alpha-ketoacid dehydrogenase subunit beta [Chloroflexi bacterium]|nr:alpha-ketoacid dehydrogenase subunit beta [Chloroflexota bacterium]
MRELTVSQALNEALREEMLRDPHLFLIGEDIGGPGGMFKVTQGLLAEFGPQRVVDTPISELAIVGAAVGAALTGVPVVAELMYSDWITIAMDQIVNQAAKLRFMTGGQVSVPIVVRAPTGGGLGMGPQHMQSLQAWFAHIPGLKVVLPANAADAKGLLKVAIRDPNPVVFLEHKGLYNRTGPVPEGEHLAPLGKAAVLRTGGDVTLVATSFMVEHALAAADELAAEGIAVEVIDPRSLRPFDLPTVLASLSKTGRLVVVDEGHRTCGWAAEVVTAVVEKAFYDLDAPPERVTAADAPIGYARALEEEVLPSRAKVVAALRRVLGLPAPAPASAR